MGRRPPLTFHRISQSFKGRFSLHMSGEDGVHLSRAAAPGSIASGFRGAEAPVMQIGDAARLQRSAEHRFRKPCLARQRHRPHIQQRPNTRSLNQIEELVLDQPLISDGKKISDQARPRGRNFASLSYRAVSRPIK